MFVMEGVFSLFLDLFCGPPLPYIISKMFPFCWFLKCVELFLIHVVTWQLITSVLFLYSLLHPKWLNSFIVLLNAITFVFTV